MGVDRRRGAIVLVVFRRVGLGIGKLRNFDLVGVDEKHCWSCDYVDLSLRDLVHHLHFSDVSHKVRSVGRDRG